MRTGLLWGIGGIAILGGAWWFWSLGTIPGPVARHMRLKIDHPTVELRHAQGSWRAAVDGEPLAEGDSLRTSADGNATIVFEGLGESRLGKSSEVTLTKAQLGTETQPLGVDLSLASGRIWSRVKRLIDLEESYSVRTDTVVATVRGTAFDLQTQTTGTTVWVSDAAVQVFGKEKPLVVSEGSMATFASAGGASASVPIDDASRQTPWFTSNIARDTSLVQRMQDERTAELAALRAAEPGTLTDAVTRASERLHLALDHGNAPALFAGYTLRRLVAIKKLIDEGKSGQAFQTLSLLGEEIRTETAGSADSARALQRALPQFLLLIQDQDSGPSSSAHRLKQQVEDLNVSLSGEDPTAQAYARLVAIDDRLDEAESLIRVPSLDDAATALEAARQGLANVGHDIGPLPDAATDPVRALHGKFEMLSAREAALLLRLQSVQASPTAVSTDQLGVPTSTTPVVTSTTDVATSTAAAPATTTKAVPVSITLTASPSPATVRNPVQLTVMMTHPDGSTSDVTAVSQFLLIDGIGAMNGPVFTPSAVGLAHIQAMTHDAGTILKTTLEIVVQ